MRPEAAKFLRDILDAANQISNYMLGKSREAYLADSLLRDAVHWNFAVIGEALAQLQRTDPGMCRPNHRVAPHHRLPQPIDPRLRRH